MPRCADIDWEISAAFRWPGVRVAQQSNKFRWIVLKMRQALTFSATFENDHRSMKTLAVISILALLTISGAAYTDQMLVSDQHAVQRGN
ncbi:hypothetical protein [Bradyrhizobium sp.]|uniref:hypothetical protein n=1 Tax=Bradyrhizobium sp. TaxID=376 RepID=UPI004037CAF6